MDDDLRNMDFLMRSMMEIIPRTNGSAAGSGVIEKTYTVLQPC